jgi:HAD superfamily hydrolase (TIGR01509 family)
MDGVLMDARGWHFEALNRALRLYGIEVLRQDHLPRFDGLPTSKKLEMLTIERGLPKDLHQEINDKKQVFTHEIVEKECRPLECHQKALSKLKSEGYKLAMCSNAVRITVDMMIKKAEVEQYLDFSLSNQDVENPNPEIYTKAINRLGLKPQECLIVEDRPHALQRLRQAVHMFWKLEPCMMVTYSNIKNRIREIEKAAHCSEYERSRLIQNKMPQVRGGGR